jgi:hypothetical protein
MEKPIIRLSETPFCIIELREKIFDYVYYGQNISYVLEYGDMRYLKRYKELKLTNYSSLSKCHYFSIVGIALENEQFDMLSFIINKILDDEDSEYNYTNYNIPFNNENRCYILLGKKKYKSYNLRLLQNYKIYSEYISDTCLYRNHKYFGYSIKKLFYDICKEYYEYTSLSNIKDSNNNIIIYLDGLMEDFLNKIRINDTIGCITNISFDYAVQEALNNNRERIIKNSISKNNYKLLKYVLERINLDELVSKIRILLEIDFTKDFVIKKIKWRNSYERINCKRITRSNITYIFSEEIYNIFNEYGVFIK